MHFHTRAQCRTLARAANELRINDVNKTWRVIYRIDDDAILVVEVFKKKTRATPRQIIANCKRRLRLYDEAAGN